MTQGCWNDLPNKALLSFELFISTQNYSFSMLEATPVMQLYRSGVRSPWMNPAAYNFVLFCRAIFKILQMGHRVRDQNAYPFLGSIRML